VDEYKGGVVRGGGGGKGGKREREGAVLL